MYREIDYTVFCEIHLSLEPYHNAGISPERSKEIIENIRDPFSIMQSRFYCQPAGINRNWKIKTLASDWYSIRFIVGLIEEALENELAN